KRKPITGMGCLEFVMMTGTIKNSSPPLVIELIEAEGTVWMLSFNGSNPDENDAIELTKEQCFWLFDKIMNIDPNLFYKTKEIC
ncbi:TPA: hypothetical protein ACF2EP_003780, partial [Acinetobacter baumannii]